MRYQGTLISIAVGACVAAASCSTGTSVGGVPKQGRLIDRVASKEFKYSSVAIGRDRDLNLHRGDGLGLVYAPPLSVYLNSVMSRLVKVSPVDGAPIRVFLRATPQWGATTSADANIYLNLGLLMELENEDELAAVLAHELSHIVLRHHASDAFEDADDKVRTATTVARGVELGLLMAGIIDSPVVNGNELLDQQAELVELSTQVLVPGWNRRQETEADVLGTDFLVAAGYNKVAMLSVLDKQRAFEQSVAADAAAADPEPEPQPRDDPKRKKINLGGVQLGVSPSSLLSPLGRKHRRAEDRRETVQTYIAREYRRAPRPRIKGEQWNVIVEGGTTQQLMSNYARAFEAEQRLVLGDVEGARMDLMRATSGPTRTHAYPRFITAQAWMQQGNKEQALASLETAFANPEPSVKVFQVASALHLEAGRVPEAVAVLERAYELFDATPALTPDLERAYRAANRDDDAKAVVRRCRKEYPRLEELCDPDSSESGPRVTISAK